jgi:hypothetical protein
MEDLVLRLEVPGVASRDYAVFEVSDKLVPRVVLPMRGGCGGFLGQE